MATSAKKSRFAHTCEVCDLSTTHLNKHTLRTHVPWYVSPSTACVDCHKSEGFGKDRDRFHKGHRLISGENLLGAWFLLMNGLFLFMSRELGLNSSTDLLTLAAAQHLPKTLKISEEEYFYFREFDLRAGLEPLSIGGYMTLPPTRLCIIGHPAVMTALLAKFTVQSRSAFVRYAEYLQFDGSSPSLGFPQMKMGIIDSHCHLDKLSNRKDMTLLDLETMETDIKIHLPFVIANYVYPTKWDFIGDRVREDPRIKLTFGIHPHMIVKAPFSAAIDQSRRLEEMLGRHPEAVGIGEVGLDFTATCTCSSGHDSRKCIASKIEAQRRFLRPTLQLAKRLNKVLVVHVRDHNTGKAAKEFISLLQELDMCNHPIHRHCFTGNETEFKQWTETLPNCLFSIGPISLRKPSTVNAMRTFGLSKLMLETDAPYMQNHKRPWHVHAVAEGLAEKLNLSVFEVIRVCNMNTARLYSLTW